MKKFEDTMLYNLCGITHAARILEDTIKEINKALFDIAHESASSANIILLDSAMRNHITVYSNYIDINISNIKLPLLTIREFIINYYRNEGFDVDEGTAVENNICIKWENYIKEYIDHNTKSIDDDDTPQNDEKSKIFKISEETDEALKEKIIDAIQSFIELESDKRDSILLRFQFIAYMADADEGHDIFISNGDANILTGILNICIPETPKYHNIVKEIIDYYVQSTEYKISNKNPEYTENGFVSYTIEKISTDVKTQEVVDCVAKMYYLRKTWEDKESQLGVFCLLDAAKKACSLFSPDYTVFDWDGKPVFGKLFNESHAQKAANIGVKAIVDEVIHNNCCGTDKSTNKTASDPITQEGSYTYRP